MGGGTCWNYTESTWTGQPARADPACTGALGEMRWSPEVPASLLPLWSCASVTAEDLSYTVHYTTCFHHKYGKAAENSEAGLSKQPNASRNVVYFPFFLVFHSVTFWDFSTQWEMTSAADLFSWTLYIMALNCINLLPWKLNRTVMTQWSAVEIERD